MSNKHLKKCSICSSSNLQELLDLPSLPLTGLYFPTKEQALSSDSYDQGLNICKDCGHVQLRNAIDPEKVYDDTYTHRSSGSPISKSGNDFLFNYLNTKFNINSETKLLEVGCNDGYLLEKISPKTKSAVGIDPIWINNTPPESDSYKIFGGYANEVHNKIPPKYSPNFVVSAHTFEHTVSLFDELKFVVDFAEEDSDFVIEMPSFDTLLRLRRFDQVFHQHIQYISESSISVLVKRLKCSLIDIKYNYSYWGGTVIFSFKKGLSNNHNFSTNQINSQDLIDEAISDFNLYRNLLAKQVCFHEKIFYLGAAQMLPILHYHLKSEIPNIEAIFDDNKLRIGKFLPSLHQEIIPLAGIKKEELFSAGLIVGAVDSGKALISRTRDIGLANIYSYYQNII